MKTISKTLYRIWLVFLQILWPLVSYKWTRKCQGMNEHDADTFCHLTLLGTSVLMCIGLCMLAAQANQPRPITANIVSIVLMSVLYAMLGWMNAHKVTRMHDRGIYLRSE